MKRKLALAVVLVAVIAAGITYYYYNNRNADLPQVKAVKVTRAQIEAKVYTTGKIDMLNKQEVRVLTPGTVKNVAVAVGDKVKKGDLLLEMETRDLDLQVKQAQAAVDVAKANLATVNDRVTQLEQAAANPAQALPQVPSVAALPGLPSVVTETLSEAKNAQKQAQAMVNQAQAALDLVRNQRNNGRITAALAGTVLAVNTAAGQPASPQAPMAVVGDLEHLLVLADVNEVDAGKLAPGQPVTISGSTLGDREFSGKVISVAPMAQTLPSMQGSQTTVQAKIEIDKPDPALKPGFSVSLTVITSSKPNVLQVPQEAIFTEDKVKYVYVLRNNVLSKTKVSTGISGDLNMEISSGLNEGDQVVLNPSKNLREGLKVRVE